MAENRTKTDNELLQSVQAGQAAATDELILRYRSNVEAIAAKYSSAPLEKDDLIQEGLIGLLAAITSYNPNKGTQFATYATRCIHNSILTALKKVSRLKDIPPANMIALDEISPDTQYTLSAEDEFLAKESVSTLTEILYEGLSSFENEVLRLHIVGCSYQEIADKLNKNPKAIDNAIQRIRKKLSGVTF